MATHQQTSGWKKRRYKRSYKIYRIQYGPKGNEHKAYARRLSEAGLFIDSNFAVYPKDTPLIMYIEIEGRIFTACGTVRNCRKTDARFIHILKPGMGVEFTQISPELKEIISRA